MEMESVGGILHVLSIQSLVSRACFHPRSKDFVEILNAEQVLVLCLTGLAGALLDIREASTTQYGQRHPLGITATMQ
jgi:hypothetical protein